jgi:L-threonylcarbamoyladenylate synthase
VSRIFELHPNDAGGFASALSAAADALAAGGLVVLPTETVYGIATRPDDPKATARLFAAKRRPLGLNLPVLAASAREAWQLGVADDRARRLADAFWPGPLTIVLQRTKRSELWNLGQRQDSIALRVPDHDLTSSLLRHAGPAAATSANLSGAPPLSDRDELLAAFGESVALYLVLASGATLPGGTPSTVADLTGAAVRILRPGPIHPEWIESVAAGRRTPE